MSRQAYRLGLTGYPLEVSLSPRLHQAALRACGLEGEYRLYPILPDTAGIMGLRELLECVRRGEVDGLNVTIPHKQSVLRLLDEVSETARAIGAVNTIYARGQVLVGENTDAAGFLSDLRRRRQQARPGTALVLGAGGAARAVVYALERGGWQVSVAARRAEQAEEVRRAISDNVTGLALEAGAVRRLVEEGRVELIVNATPLGMGKRAGESAWPAGVRLPGMALVYDLVYNPPETELMQAAREAGLPASNGLGMLIDQAMLAFRLWTGCEPEREALERAVE